MSHSETACVPAVTLDFPVHSLQSLAISLQGKIVYAIGEFPVPEYIRCDPIQAQDGVAMR